MADNTDVSALAQYRVRDTEVGGAKIQHMLIDNAFAPTRYDEIEMTYSGDNIATVIYKLSGATVGTLTLGYTGANLTSVVRS